MSSIEVEPIDGPDEPVPVDGLAAELTNSVGVPNDAGPDDAVPNALADEVEEYSAHAEQRDSHLAEQEADQDDEQPAQSHKQRVPLAAMQEERRARQAAQEQVRLLQEQLAAHQAQMQQFQQWQQQLAAQQQQAQQQAEIPAFIDDPEGHVNALRAQFEQRLNDMQGQQQATVHRQQLEQAAVQVQHELTQLAPQLVAVENEFAARHSDYHQAYEHLDRQVDARIAQQYPGASPEQRAFAKQIASLAFLRDCAAKGENPAERLYNKAAELGYQTQHRAPSMKRAPTSLGALPGGGRAPDEQGRLSASQVASMSNEDFDRLFEQMRANDAPRFGF
ncbi:hypothetical protein [Pseudomonas sp. A2]|uniref:hypothetical protein n=1 Tax=Pseudomonas sp. A2 TaxID=107445 RepID=UPI002000590C|nr:hypothetical protein [Pseudomonas sp. A2]UPK87347.1 hypothetical protein E5221_21270 [Pseudomonas sp. A2]